MTLLLTRKQIRALDDLLDTGKSSFVRKTQRKARENRVLNIQRFSKLSYTKSLIGSDTHYITKDGGHLILSDNYIAIKLPYGLSANNIWRATIKDDGNQTNSLSVGAKNYKKNITNMYCELLDKIDFKRITSLCEVRLVIQPPIRNKNYSAQTYPRYDIDNYPKLLIDSLKGMLFKDDNLFIEESIQLAKPIKNGCAWLSCILKKEDETNWLNKDVDFTWLSGKEG